MKKYYRERRRRKEISCVQQKEGTEFWNKLLNEL
jgi:hypothetical protein